MNVYFRSKRLNKICNDNSIAIKQLGKSNAKKLRRRLDDISAASCLADLRRSAGRLHELSGDYDGKLSINLSGKLRLIIEPAENPKPEKEDGGLDWDAVRSITIFKIVDYH